MPDRPGPGTPTAPRVPPTAGGDARVCQPGGTVHPESTPMNRVGWGFISLYTLAFMSTCLVLLAPLLVSLALKVNSLVGTAQAPTSLALVTGVGRRRAAGQANRREGSRCLQHRRRAALFVAPAIAPAILAVGGGSYGVLYAVAGVCALIGAVAILPMKGVR